MITNILSVVLFLPCAALNIYILWKWYQDERNDEEQLWAENPEDPTLSLAGSAPLVIILVAVISLPMIFGLCFVVSMKIVAIASSFF